MRVLDIEATMDAARAVAGFDDIGDSAEAMGRAVDKAADKVGASASKLDATAEAADNLDSKSAAATGALGALSSGFELVGMEKYATGLQSAAMATDFLSGVGASANLIMQSSAVLKAKDLAITAGRTAATVAATAATTVATAAQWALNAAMSANPVALVVLAVVALVAIFVVLYRKSDTVREAVRKVGEVGERAIGWVVDVAEDLGKWFKDKLPGALGVFKTIAVNYIRIATWPLRTMIDVGKNVWEWFHDKLPGAFETLKDKAQGIAAKLVAPFQRLLDIALDVLDTLNIIERKQSGGGMHNLSDSDFHGGQTNHPDDTPGNKGRTSGRTVVNNNTVNVQGPLDERVVRRIANTQANLMRRVGATS